VRAAALIATLALGACAPKPQTAPPAVIPLDCSQPFEALKARVVAQPNLDPAPPSPAEPYQFYSTPDGKASYLITEPGAPGHPAIMMQKAEGGTIRTTGCPYGDRKGYDELHAYLDSLKSWRRTP